MSAQGHLPKVHIPSTQSLPTMRHEHYLGRLLCCFVTMLMFLCVATTGHSQNAPSSKKAGLGSSQDWWDMRFHPERYKARQEARMEEWFKQWENSTCTAEHVKQLWLITLTVPEPAQFSRDHKDAVAHNKRIEAAIQGGSVDFEAADLADQINVKVLRANGKLAEAERIEAGRQERLRQREELKNQRQQQIAAARESALQAQIDMLQRKIRRAEQAASAAEAEATRMKRDRDFGW